MPEPVTKSVRLMLERDLLREGAYTVAELAQRFGVSERSIYGDLATLQEEPLWQNVVQLPSRYFIAPVGGDS